MNTKQCVTQCIMHNMIIVMHLVTIKVMEVQNGLLFVNTQSKLFEKNLNDSVNGEEKKVLQCKAIIFIV